MGKAWLKKYVLRLFRKDKYVGEERIVLGKWFQRNGAAWAMERESFDFLLKNGNVRGLKEEERRECEFNLCISNEFKYCGSPNESARWVIQHSLELIRYWTGSQGKDLRTGVICDERKVRVTIRVTEFCIFCSD